MLAALVFRPSEVSERALSRGFAVALAGWDVPAPRLLVAPLREAPGWSAAFYASGVKLAKGVEHEEGEHACDLFEDELAPGLGVIDAAAEEGSPSAVVYAVVFDEEGVHDDAWRFSAEGVRRRFVREGDDELEVGYETPEEAHVSELCVPVAPNATEDEEQAAIDRAAAPHRGTTFAGAEIGAPLRAALMGALFLADRRIDIRLVEPTAAAVAAETQRLNRALGRVDGRGAAPPPRPVGGVAAPETYVAFARTYDWADPRDPGDLYRELAIGRIEGTLRFLRDAERDAVGDDTAWSAARAEGLFPIASLRGSALAAARFEGTIGLGRDGATLMLVRSGAPSVVAGPTFGELLRYLALGWTKRTEAEDDMIEALMLRAKVRVGG